MSEATAARSESSNGLRELRALLGLSQEKFARKLGVTTRTIARWEATPKLPTHTLMQLHNYALATGFGTIAAIFRRAADEGWTKRNELQS